MARAATDALVEEQLRNIRDDLLEVKQALGNVNATLDGVRVSELAAIRANVHDLRIAHTLELGRRDTEIAKLQGELGLVRDQVGRTAAKWGAISSIVSAAIVGAVLKLVMSG